MVAFPLETRHSPRALGAEGRAASWWRGAGLTPTLNTPRVSLPLLCSSLSHTQGCSSPSPPPRGFQRPQPYSSPKSHWQAWADGDTEASGEQAPLSLLQRWAVCADPTKVTPSSPTS